MITQGDIEAVHSELLAERADETLLRDRSMLRERLRRIDPVAAPDAVDDAVDRLVNRIGGLGRLEPYLCDDAVNDIMVNGDGTVWTERLGVVAPTGLRLEPTEVAHVVERALGPSGRRVDWSQPWADARLPDGSRVHVVVPPIAVDGTLVTIRRFSVRRLGLDAFTRRADIAERLAAAVVERRNIVVSGATGSGKTSLVNSLAAFIADDERIVTIEDAAELRLDRSNVVRLETRPAGLDGRGEVTIRELVRNALRMRPDRIIVGEVRGAEAFDMVQAMLTGHDGSLSTVHADGCAQALDRLHSLVSMAEVAIAPEIARRQLTDAVDLVVHLRRTPEGRRRVEELAELGPDGLRVLTRADDRGAAQ